MSDNTDLLRQRVQAIMPELAIQQFEINQDGLINDVAIVNNKLVFRFIKAERYAKILDNEIKILRLVRNRTDLEIPAPIYQSHDSIVYPFLNGTPFLRETLLKLKGDVQTKMAEQLGKFLYDLHTANTPELDWEIPPTLASTTFEKWLDIRQQVTEKIYPLLLKHQIQWAENLFDSVLTQPDSFKYRPSLIHGDLAPYHILFDQNKSEITGIIDFGVAGIGDPAIDVGNLISAYGESFISKMQAMYPHLDELLPRARFYAQAIEFQWVLLGIETGETFWFTAHLGGARDILA